jgi:Ethanolamine utilization protein EutJ (predicted chaperonin)
LNFFESRLMAGYKSVDAEDAEKSKKGRKVKQEIMNA